MIQNPHMAENLDVFYANNKKLILFIANRYHKRIVGSILDFEDLVHIAYIGFQQAYERYTPTIMVDGEEQAIRFSTFAFPYMKGEILRGIEKYRTPIKYSRPIQELARDILYHELDMEPISVIQATLHVSEKEVADALHYLIQGNAISLDYNPTPDEDNPLSNLVPFYDDISDFDLLSVISTCEEKELAVLEGRMRGLTQREISFKMGVSQMYVSRTLKRVKKKYDIHMRG